MLLADWRRYQSTVALADLKRDRDKRNMVLHAMLVAIQAAVDIGSHLIAEYRLRRPSTYRETFEVLFEGGLVPEGLAGQLADLAGFRNVLVHIYWKIDLDEAFEILQRDRKALNDFIRLVKEMLSE
jgi:uncharacterized protein YutE (UPF0331/DUF86 family)